MSLLTWIFSISLFFVDLILVLYIFHYVCIQVPVSIADLGGTEIDLRFGSSKEGKLFVIVAPVLRFSDGEVP